MTQLPNPFMSVPLTPKTPATRPEPELWLNGARGVYIPRDFANSFKDRDTCVTGVSAEDWRILEEGPDHPLYWEAWNDLLFRGDVLVTDSNGQQYFPYQDDDLWLWVIPVGMEWDEEQDCYVWPEDEA